MTAYQHHALLLRGKSRDEGIAKSFEETTGIEAHQNDRFSKYVCRQCSRKIKAFAQFKALCVDSDKNQRNKRTKVTDLRQKSGKKQEESPSGPPESQSRTQSPRAFWPAGERPERLWDNRLHFPRKRGFRSYCACLSFKRK